MIGQMIMVGFKEAEVNAQTPVVKAIRDFSLGGVILYNIDLPSYLKAQRRRPELSRQEAALLFPKNIISVDQLKDLTSTLRSFSRCPLLIAVDQEGGIVSRLSPAAGFPERESPQELGAEDNLAKTAMVAEEIAKDLRKSGINLNLAPVVDLALHPEGPIAKNGRSFGTDPELVYRHSRAFILAHRGQGVLTCLKHFPGEGNVAKDTHYEIAEITNSYQQEEFWPFQRLIEEGLAELIMTAHVWHREWETDLPITLSAKVLQGILRQKLGYQGPIITDDLLMGAIRKQFSLPEACVLAVRAGANILLASNNSPEGYEEDLFDQIYEAIVKGVEKRMLSPAMIESSYARIQELKKSLSA